MISLLIVLTILHPTYCAFTDTSTKSTCIVREYNDYMNVDEQQKSFETVYHDLLKVNFKSTCSKQSGEANTICKKCEDHKRLDMQFQWLNNKHNSCFWQNDETFMYDRVMVYSTLNTAATVYQSQGGEHGKQLPFLDCSTLAEKNEEFSICKGACFNYTEFINHPKDNKDFEMTFVVTIALKRFGNFDEDDKIGTIANCTVPMNIHIETECKVQKSNGQPWG